MSKSKLPLDPLAVHLANFHLVETADGRSLLMRWYDTRILPVWLDVLTEEQRKCFTHPIAQWISIDRFGIEQPHAPPKHDADTAITSHTPLRLDEHQVEHLFAEAEPDALICELRKTIRSELDRIPQHILYPFVRSHWQMARKYGLHERGDQIRFLMLALHTSGAFVELPGITELFDSSSKHDSSFSQRLDTLPESVWMLGKPMWDRASGQDAINYQVTP